MAPIANALNATYVCAFGCQQTDRLRKHPPQRRRTFFPSTRPRLSRVRLDGLGCAVRMKA
jgi:hypothetical protein